LKNTLIKDALLITMDDIKPDYFRGDILVKGSLVAAISEAPASIDSESAETVIDGKDLIVMPGFVNAHGHAAMTLLRSYADDMPLKEWLENKIWPTEERLESDDVYWGSMLAITEMIKGGTTTFADMYFFMERVAEAAAESGIRAVLSRGMIGIGPGGDDALKNTEEFIKNWHGTGGGRINVTLGPHAPYTCPPEYLLKVMDLAGKTGRPMQIHLSETKGEVEESFSKYSKSPIELVHDLGLFNYRVIAAHCVHLSDRDIEILAENNVGVAHNPGSNLKLGSGLANITKMLQSGINVGIGTDGASSNNNLDMIEEMRLVALLSKGVNLDPTLIPAKTAIKIATEMGAKVLFLEDTGVLKEGYRADLIGLNCNRPHMVPMHDPLAQVAYSAAAADVSLVMVDGNILLENGSLTTLDEEKIMAETAQRATRLTGTK
jgi:5-methylthioadenosine/S-adenosylhomocysteine deaminase